jgi:homoserine O-succinyltransferase
MANSQARAAGSRQVTVALVNNMPDGAFADTEEQFRRAVTGGPDGDAVELRLYSIDELPRSEATTELIRASYLDLDDLWSNPPDALIITGTEPVQAQLPYEPYWPVLARLVEWAASAVPTTMLSCLAAHACALMFDGIERVQRPAKCSGVFTGKLGNSGDAIAAGLPDAVPIPHSHVYEVPEDALVDAGYRIIIGAGETGAGWSVATRNFREGLLVLCQGHPEYSTVSLLREYRRDVRRFLLGRGALPYPALPKGYLGPEAVAILDEFKERASAPGVDAAELAKRFPFDEVAATVENTWDPSSWILYRNWLEIARDAAGIRAATARA